MFDLFVIHNVSFNAFPIYKVNKTKHETTHYKICLNTRSWSETLWQEETTKEKKISSHLVFNTKDELGTIFEPC